MKTKKEILAELKECKAGVEECEETDSLIYQGWVEALRWVLDNYPDNKSR